MKTRKIFGPWFAICINNSEYPVSLELHKIYRVIPEEGAAQDGDLRIINESGEDYLYSADYFVMIELPREVVRVLHKLFLQAFNLLPKERVVPEAAASLESAISLHLTSVLTQLPKPAGNQ